MDMKRWLKSTTPIEREAVANIAETKSDYLNQLAGRHRRPSIKLTQRLVTASEACTPDRPLTLSGLRPDIWDSSVA